MLPQALRNYCNVPVAIGSSERTTVFPINDLFLDFAHEPTRTRLTLFVIADTSQRINSIFRGLEPVGRVVALNTRFLRKTISDRPRELVTEEYRFVVAKVPAPH